MKRFIYPLLLLFPVGEMASQTVTVRDGLTHEPVPFAIITGRLPAPNIRLIAVTTNETGQADISILNKPDSLYVRQPAYGTQGFSFAKVRTDSFQVYLQPRSLIMNEVIFSASKTAEERKDVPYSVKVIDNRQVAF